MVTASTRPFLIPLLPTAKQEIALPQEIASSEVPPGTGIGTSRQDLPFQLSAMTDPEPPAVRPERPTAWHDAALVQATPVSRLTIAPALSAGRVARHDLPFHCSARACCTPSVPTYQPAAVHDDPDEQDTPRNWSIGEV